jgi:uncharacterized protein YbgA (DUF1722 family)
MILFLVKLKEFSKGKQLAEEFEDYPALIEICDELKDIEQLRTFVEKYGDKVNSFIKIKKKNFNKINIYILVYGYI